MSERTLILPVKTVRDPAYNHYLGPVEYNCYEFDNGDKAHSVLFYTHHEGYEPYKDYYQAIVDKDDNYTYPPAEAEPSPELVRLTAIAEEVTKLIVAAAEAQEATTVGRQAELAYAQ
jgi:hypothetical protein